MRTCPAAIIRAYRKKKPDYKKIRRKEKRMSNCPDCGKDMNRANGCSVCEIEINGEWYKKLKFGTDDDYYHWADKRNRCSDCGAKLGYYHHSGCEMNICPKCGNMAASCICMNFGRKKMLPKRK